MSSPRPMTDAILGEFRRYKQIGEGVMSQLSDAELIAAGPKGTNAVAVIVWHLSGNFRSRFTGFLTTDGEKAWRQREEEFASRSATRAEILERWEEGWRVVFGAVAALDDRDLDRQITIRSQPLAVRDALVRSLAHVSYHVGQMVLLGRIMRGANWKFLSIPPRKSDEYNRAPTLDRPPER